MKVVRVIARLNVGGPARHVTILADRLRAAGFDTLLVYGRVADGEASLEHLVADRRIRGASIPALGRRLNPFDDLRAFLALLRLIFHEQPDVIHTHTSKAGFLGRLAAAVYNGVRRLRGLRPALVVHTFHGHVLSGYFGAVGSALARLSERLLSRVTDITVAISERQKHDLVDVYHVARAERVAVVPLGLELDDFLAMRPADQRTPVTFGYIGRIVPIKRLDVLIDAFAAAWQEVRDIQLRIVGDGPDRRSIEERAARAGVAPAVHFDGWQHSLADVYGGLDAVVLTSDNEGTPVALIEAMAAARPVIATAVGGVADVVQPGTGVLAGAGDVRGLAAAMVALSRDARQRRVFGEQGRAFVARAFAADRLVRDISNLYDRGLARRGVAAVASR